MADPPATASAILDRLRAKSAGFEGTSAVVATAADEKEREREKEREKEREREDGGYISDGSPSPFPSALAPCRHHDTNFILPQY